jgi:hypothetical protein
MALNNPFKMIQGSKDQSQTDGSLALKRVDHTPSDPVKFLTVERVENGYVLRCEYPEGDSRVLIFAPHLKNQLMEAIESRL